MKNMCVLLLVFSLSTVWLLSIYNEQRKTQYGNTRVATSREATHPNSENSVSYNQYKPPKGESPKQRFPHSIIIGFRKCGTRALLNFLSLHPNIQTSRYEMHFYDVDSRFSKGYNWYKEQMPLSYSDQVTIEKTPAYVTSDRARRELSALFPGVKLIVLVREPVERVLSDYAQMKAQSNLSLTEFLYKTSKTGDGDGDGYRLAVHLSMYDTYLTQWFAAFNRSQLLVVDGNKLVTDPLSVLKKVESFLGLPRLFTKDNFFRSKTKGFYCAKGFEMDAEVHCLGESKGRPHDALAKSERETLARVFRPHNQKLFNLTGEMFVWD